MATASGVVQDVSLTLKQRQTVASALKLKHASVLRAAKDEQNPDVKVLRDKEAAEIMQLSSLFVL